ncbi:MAG: AlkA N-terminal domain-containing protein [Pusillimonas sp.]
MHASLSCRVPLPPSFRFGDMLAFHQRDAHEIAERVKESSLRKGLLWQGVPACLNLRFLPGQALAELALDGAAAPDSQALLEATVRRMLGLAQDVDTFERQYRRHPLVGGLIQRQAGLRVPVAVTPFEALSWAIIGQQISVGAATSIRRKLIQATGLRHSSGLLCHPGPDEIAALGPDGLRQAGFSAGKAATLIELAPLIANKQLPLDDWLQAPPVEDIRERLLAVRGIGPWTVSYTLLRGFGWLDGSLHGDVAVRRGIEALLGAPGKLNEKQAKIWLEEFSPWRALLAAHLWASRSNTAY